MRKNIDERWKTIFKRTYYFKNSDTEYSWYIDENANGDKQYYSTDSIGGATYDTFEEWVEALANFLEIGGEE